SFRESPHTNPLWHFRHRGKTASEVLRIARQHLELVGIALRVGERDLIAGPLDAVAILVLALVLGADLLALDRPLALGLLAVVEEHRGAVLVEELPGHGLVVLAGERVADDRQGGLGALRGLIAPPP